MIKEYFKILEPQYPYWLNDYINVEEITKAKIYKYNVWYNLF